MGIIGIVKTFELIILCLYKNGINSVLCCEKCLDLSCFFKETEKNTIVIEKRKENQYNDIVGWIAQKTNPAQTQTACSTQPFKEEIK